MLWISNSCNVTSHVPTYTNIIITFHMCKMFFTKKYVCVVLVLLFSLFIVNFHQKHLHFHLQLGFFSVTLPFIILYSPYSNLLDNVGVLLRLDSLCYVYSQTIFIFLQIHLQQQQQGKCAYTITEALHMFVHKLKGKPIIYSFVCYFFLSFSSWCL